MKLLIASSYSALEQRDTAQLVQSYYLNVCGLLAANHKSIYTLEATAGSVFILAS